ncbi:MAG TPA: alpha-ketoacid dehydrogenase subunit beta [Dehalococcoidia bacterium]|jgi:pyruvate/2-oxoglutarate/acetoin dehydrogenase E1 component|nr:alpha-ketoacid dehydrogenase subunit beta [Dehalococcoidia bacterium]
MRELTYREAIREALREEMKRDPKVFLMGEEIAEYGGSYKVTLGLVDEFGHERVRNTPLAEASIAGAALGAALVGMRPVAEIMYIDFSFIAADQIINQIAKLRYMTGGMVKVPVVIRTQGGGGVAAGPHHSQSLEAIYAHIPGLFVVMPSNAYDAKGLLKSSIREDNPVMFIEHKKLYGEACEVPEEEYLIPLGKGEIKRPGKDITVVAYSRCVLRALNAAQDLAKEGIELEVVDPRTLKPLDEDIILSSVQKTGKAMVVYEACRTGGFGAEIAAIISEKAFDYLDAPIKRVAALDSPVPFNPKMEDYVLPNEDNIKAAARELMGK